jgi:hypothetical protein
MRFSFLVATLFLGAVAASGPVLASESGPHTVKSGVQTIVLSYASYNPETCYHSALPDLRVVTPPAHGSLVFGKYAHKVGKGPCEGKTMKSSAVAYRSKPGFRGRDEMVVEASTYIYVDALGGRRGDAVRITVDVK